MDLVSNMLIGSSETGELFSRHSRRAHAIVDFIQDEPFYENVVTHVEGLFGVHV